MVKNNKKQPTQRKAPRPGRAIATGPKGPKVPNRVARPRGGGAVPRSLAITVKHGLDAFHPTHIPLPTSVAPYHVIRTTKRFVSNNEVFIFGPTYSDASGTRRQWANQIGWTTATDSTAVSAALTSMLVPLASTFGEHATEATPAAFSVRVRCTDSLFTASGTTYIGRYKSVIDGPDSADVRTFSDLFDSSVSYAPYYAATNSHLATSPKQINLLPGDVSDLNNFSPIVASGTATWSAAGANTFAGFCPGYIWNPSAANLEIEIAVEWRVRVDPYNPLAASGVQHAPTPPGVWHAITSAAQSAGHGVEDVVAAGAGMAVAQLGGFEGIMSALGTFAAGALPSLETLAPLLLL